MRRSAATLVIAAAIAARPGVTAQDLRWAELSARSLGVSSAGRG